jgi:hypothetical protein
MESKIARALDGLGTTNAVPRTAHAEQFPQQPSRKALGENIG